MRGFQRLDDVDVDVDVENPRSISHVDHRKLTSTERLRLLTWLNMKRAIRNWSKFLINMVLPLIMVILTVVILSIDFYPVQPEPGAVALDPSSALASPKTLTFPSP